MYLMHEVKAMGAFALKPYESKDIARPVGVVLIPARSQTSLDCGLEKARQ